MLKVMWISLYQFCQLTHSSSTSQIPKGVFRDQITFFISTSLDSYILIICILDVLDPQSSVKSHVSILCSFYRPNIQFLLFVGQKR